MKLTSIKAHGFKSFADKIEITIDNGITGIVGPNGSGKSNVVDAVKWVLGENSLKELRGGDTSTDVIFNGSKTRPQSSRAWVSLTFDNSDHFLATDLETVEIKREVYKTGENEYFINNAKVRKKDITDLFLDTGATSNSFSIISQGKIIEVLKGKSTDRRQIIEEAAGVLKYKKRKEETLRKLDSAQNNLDKVNLVIDELSVNLEPLRIQSEDARKYLEYKEELKGIEVSLIASDIKNISNTSDIDKNKLNKLNEELLNMDNSNSIDTTKIEELKTRNIKIDEEINRLSDEVINLTKELSELETQKQVISERKKYEVSDIKLENNILLLKDEELKYQKDLSLLDEELSTNNNTYEKEQDKYNKLQEEYRLTNIKKNTLLTELNNRSRLEIGLKNKIDAINDQIDNDTKLPYAVKSVLNNPRLQGIHDVLSKIIDTEEKYVLALEIALGANANVIITDDELSATKAIEYLKDNKLGRATFFPISIIKSRYIDDETIKTCKSVAGFIDVASNLVSYNPLYKGIIENQLGNTLIVNNIDTMNKLGKLLNYRYRIITLDGELLHTGGALTGGINKKSNGLLNTKFELDKLNKELDITIREEKNLEQDINNTDSELKILESNIVNQNILVTNINEKINIIKNNINSVREKLMRIQKEINGTNNLLNKTDDDELDNVLNEYLKVSTNRDLTTNKLNNLKMVKNDLMNEINELESINRAKNSEYNKKLNEIKNLEINISKMDIKLDSLLTRLSEEYEMTYEKANEEYSLDMDEVVARSKVNGLKRSIKDLGDVNVGSISEYERINERYTFLVEQKNDLCGAIDDLLKIINDLDETMKNKFSETFDKVNVEFSNIFKKLFKGGEATLKLTDPTDMLITGIDIIACPPGKNLKSINALSGGEMTLTAIALLFSILKIKTVPFCILDEVEAALDEANVDQFGTYIKEYENNSQFIVITHKKRTMEYANTLYGITMQESGVSKLVSVRLENIE